MLLPLLTAFLLAADTLASPPPAPEAGAGAAAAISVHRQPAVPLVALRLALVASDPPGYAGAGHLVQHLVHPTLREQAAHVGARVQLERTADAVVFTITGPTAELGYMAEILRAALRPGVASEGALLRASRELAEERLAEWETAERHVRSALRLRLFPRDVSAAGTEPSAARLAEGDAVREAWSRMYRPERVSITAVGDVTVEQIRSAFGELPAAVDLRTSGAARDTVSALPLAPAEATRAWLAAGYPASSADPAVLSVAVRVALQRLRERVPEGASTGEHWWSHHGQALVLIAAVPGAQMSAAQRALGTAVATAASGATAAEVAAAAQSIRRELLFYSRTPERMAGVLGEFADRRGDPDEAQRFHERLGRVTVREVRQVLQELTEQTPARIEIPPQRLIRR